MKKIFQIHDKNGDPVGGRVFIAPDEDSLNASISEAMGFGLVFTEVESEDDIISPPAEEVIP